MNVTVENNQVIVNLDEVEFPLFEAMFNNLDLHKLIDAEFRDFDGHSWTSHHDILPMHLCRTIGEANLSEDPFATITLYPFWKYGFAFGTGGALTLDPSQDDPHKKAVVADEMGMGFCAWAMEEVFDCETWADASALIACGYVSASGGRAPDFVCTFKDGSLGIFEAKGTTGNISNLTGALADGKLQTSAITAQTPITRRIVVGIALRGGTGPATLVILDPDGPERPVGERSGALTPDGKNGKAQGPSPTTNLTAEMVRAAARKMRTPLVPPLLRGDGRRTGGIDLSRETVGATLVGAREREGKPSPTDAGETTAPTETLFRGPKGATGAAREIKLTNEFKQDKGHGWLEKNLFELMRQVLNKS